MSSQGGDGGVGGKGRNSSVTAGRARGGDGGYGGDGGAVTFTATGIDTVSANTASDEAAAVRLESLGGTGGDGGYADAAVKAYGGDGGGGGGGGAVAVDLEDVSLSTSGDTAFGLLARSYGGAGGDHGGYNGRGGGSGGSHGGDFATGTGGTVTVTYDGEISTTGSASSGLVAQSIGGFIGSAGTSSEITSYSSGEEGAGAASKVSVTLEGDDTQIATGGLGAEGVLAQSIGGGKADDSDGVTSMGASKYGGGDGGEVELTFGAVTVSTSWIGSAAVVAQSIGAGGGQALSETAVVTNMGAADGDGGSGGEITLDGDGTSTGAIQTSSDRARGLMAQSIGGGGGDSVVDLSINDQISTLLVLGMDSSDDAGGAGGAVNLQHTYFTVETGGNHAHGILAQSIGGGGGSGGGDITYTSGTVADVDLDLGTIKGNSGAGNTVKLTTEAGVMTQGDAAHGLFAQSIGGGGGEAGVSIAGSTPSSASFTSTLGGSDGDGGASDMVTVTVNDTVDTSGMASYGVFGQSIGGGGGASNWLFALDDTSGVAIDLSVGGSGGVTGNGGGDAGEVNVDQTGAITTSGAGAMGIFAQAVGGGGALGTGETDDPAVSIGNIGNTGDGNEVTVTVSDEINVSGAYLVGVFAQSLGGTDSDGGNIEIDVNADLTSSGEQGWGIVAQSDGYDNAGTVAITVADGVELSTGSTENAGQEAIRILGGSTAGIQNDGTITTAQAFDSSPNSYAIFSDVVTVIENTGTLQGSLSLPDGVANSFVNESGGVFETGTDLYLGDSGSLTNSGTISPGGENNIIDVAIVGALSTDATDGTFLLDGDLASGDYAGEMDLIAFETSSTDAPTWYLTGNLDVNVIGDSSISSGDSGSGIIAEVLDTGEIDISGFSVTDTTTVDYTLSTEDDASSVVLGYTVDYTPEAAALTENQNTAGTHIDALVTLRKNELAALDTSADDSADSSSATLPGASGDTASAAAASVGTYAFVEDLTSHILNIETAEELRAAYDQLAPGDVFAATDGALFSSLRFSDMLGGCHATGPGAKTQDLGNGNCAWIQIGGTLRDRERDHDSIDYDEHAFGTAVGIETAIAGDWTLGAAFGYEDVRQSNTSFNSDGYRLQAGAALMRQLGAIDFTASLSGGYGSYDFTRTAFDPDGRSTATAKPDLWWGAGHVKLARNLTLQNGLSVVPSVDLGVTYSKQDAFDETGGGDYQLQISEIDSTIFSLNPAVDLTSTFTTGGMPARASFRAGLLALAGDTDRSATAQISSGGPQYILTDNSDRLFATLGAGFETQIRDRVSIEAGIDTLLSSDVQDYSGVIQLKFRF